MDGVSSYMGSELHSVNGPTSPSISLRFRSLRVSGDAAVRRFIVVSAQSQNDKVHVPLLLLQDAATFPILLIVP